GMAQLWNVSFSGSKRTMVFGLAKDSLYHSAPLVATMPYGSDFGPLGEGHSRTAPVAGSSRPRKPRAKSVYQIVSSPVMARRRGRAAASGRAYSRIAIVAGSMLATLLAPNSTKKGMPLELT